MTRRNQVAVRAQIRSTTTLGDHTLPLVRSAYAGIATPMTVELEFMGEHGPIRITLPAATLPSWLHVRGGDLPAARFEVTLRRLRKAPKRKATR